MKREQEIAEARRLRSEGSLTLREIGERLGVTRRRAQYLCQVTSPPIKRCEQCAERFAPRHGNEIYCSPDCRSKAENARKRRCAKNTGRAKCIDCSGVLGEGSRWKGQKRCRECFAEQVETQRDKKAAEAERLWAEGKPIPEIAEALGYTAGSMSWQINRLRAAGYHLPYRRSVYPTGNPRFPDQVAA